MLYITLAEPKDIKEPLITISKLAFKATFKPEWLENELAKEIISDVDKSNVLGPYCIQSPVLGQIPPEKLSGGVKMMLMMMNLDEKTLYCGEMFGDNCVKWLVRIAKERDIRITLCTIKNFKDLDGFEAIVTNSGKHITSHAEFREEYYDWYEEQVEKREKTGGEL